jgi:hypothetical protein
VELEATDAHVSRDDLEPKTAKVISDQRLRSLSKLCAGIHARAFDQSGAELRMFS